MKEPEESLEVAVHLPAELYGGLLSEAFDSHMAPAHALTIVVREWLRRSKALKETVATIAEECKLSNQEQRVLLELVRGKTAKEIGQSLSIADGTFRTHTHNILIRMGLDSTAEVIAAVKLRHKKSAKF